MHSIALSDLPAQHASLLAELGWTHTASLDFPARAAEHAAPTDIPELSAPAARLVDAQGPLFRHQAQALGHFVGGRDVVVATGTGSGKTRIFHIAAAHLLGNDSRALVLALYPSKPLAREQAEKWREALSGAGLATSGDKSVALITGDQAGISARSSALAAARVAILTPDVLHSWLLAHLGERSVRNALARTRLVVIDEAHTLAGVFGSNALLLFRRLQFALDRLRAPAPSWIAASGTLAAPGSHLEALVGRPFTVVSEAEDSSPRFARHLHFVRPAAPVSPTAGLQHWLQTAAASPDRFVVFTQSRKHTELLSMLANRDTEQESDTSSPIAAERRIAPYRAGLDPTERAELQDRFRSGELRGLVCTSAFELGIDLPGLNLGFLVGLPDSPASFWQRLGRFGRHGEAHIFLIDDGQPRSLAFFDQPAALHDWRARDAALYADNAILLARHALCLEHESAALGASAMVASHPTLPSRLRELHAALIRGEPTAELRAAQADLGNTQPPQLAFPLRACEETYTFQGAFGSSAAPLGYVTYSQLLGEAYPGAVYYHAGVPWRVTRLNRRERKITVVRERAYHTQPRTIPATLLPDLSRAAFSDLGWTIAGLRVIEAHARATEAVTGFTELQGNRSLDADYSQGVHGQSGPLFRSYETTAVLVNLPAFDDAAPGTLKIIGQLVREALISSCPREAADLATTTGTLKAARRDLPAGRRFIALYDTVPGSLRLSAALADPAVLPHTLLRAAELARERFGSSQEPEECSALRLADMLAHAIQGTPDRLPLDWPETTAAPVFAPGTHALHRRRQVVVTIEHVHVDLDGLVSYDVRRIDDPAFHGRVAADALAEIPSDFVPATPVTALAE
jgi:DEAD/DEAH box helicase domain-containing protein